MKPEVKKLWVEALRSGEYRQGQKRLKLPSHVPGVKDQFCCLGVLCDLHSKFAEDKRSWKEGLYATSETHLPRIVRVWAGLDNESPQLPMHVECTGFENLPDLPKYLVSINDRGGSFEEIATLIEAHL